MTRNEFEEKFNNQMMYQFNYIPQENEEIKQSEECDYYFKSNKGYTFSAWGKELKIIAPKLEPQTREEKIAQAQENFEIWNNQRTDKSVEYRAIPSMPFWFVADQENSVLSFWDSAEPKELTIQFNEQGRAFVVSGHGENSKTHYIHRLQAEAYPERVYVYGKATLQTGHVHHTDGHNVNIPECEEILRPETHRKLFDKRNIPLMSDDAAVHFEYMERVLEVAEEETPDQAVIVFSGSGSVDGTETKDLTQVVYADDFQGVTEQVNNAMNFSQSLNGMYALYIPVPEHRDLFEKLLKTSGEEEKLNAHVLDMFKHFGVTIFDLKYKEIELRVNIIIN